MSLDRKRVLSAAFVLSVVSVLGCQEEAEPKTAAPATSAAPTGPVVDSKVAKAVSEATRMQAAEVRAVGDGPPPNGVLALGKADAEARVGQPATLTLGDGGSGQKWLLGPGAPPPGKELKFELEVAHATGPRAALPTLLYGLSLKADKPEKIPDSEPATATEAAPLAVEIKVDKVALSENQPAAIPPELNKQIQALKGAKIRYLVAPNGAASGLTFDLGKGKDANLDGVFRPLVEAFTNFLAAYPTEPVGVGAYWMVKSREVYSHVDVVCYRMYKLEETHGEYLKISINVKRYAAKDTADLPDVPAHVLAQFAGDSSGAMAVVPGQPFPIEGALTESVQMALILQGQQQPAVVRAQGSVGLRQLVDGKAPAPIPALPRHAATPPVAPGRP